MINEIVLTFVFLFVLLTDLVELYEIHKYVRPYKYYNPKPRSRSRWISRSPKYHGTKKSPKSHYPYRPSSHRYAPLYEEPAVSDDQPYTIIIQLPKREEKRRNRYYERYYDREDARDREYIRDEDYNDQEEDFESRAFRIGEKKVRVKVTEGTGSKVHIKISRIDDDKGIELVDKNNTTLLTAPISSNGRLLSAGTSETSWLPSEPPLFFQRQLYRV
ncbi:hypothetical protein KPH14_008044 [Odynerus spinipes]|uniref:Uncharacterized protein n=1 Tax=Odynerus spinipes TaxID=1348599 RepID=A0AAD9VNV2_9HYME|nr:hypothetical protein KPH14_008044 [Odynerus spinipes]